MNAVERERAKWPWATHPKERQTLETALAIRSEFRANGYRGALESFYQIRDEDRRVHLIRLNWAQLDLLDSIAEQMERIGYVRSLILKARQIGFSTLIQGINMIDSFLHKENYAITVSYREDQAKYLHAMTTRALEVMPEGKVPLKVARTDETALHDPIKSRISVLTAGSGTGGRGLTCQSFHGSEVAYYENAATLMLGVMQAIHDTPGNKTKIFQESTANGVGNYFYEQWQLAQAGGTGFVAGFYSWHKHPEYKRDFLSEGEKQGLVRSLSEEENRLLAIGATLEHLNWRRIIIPSKCNGDENLFKQEYPATPEEAFLTSGRPSFDPKNMAGILDRARRNRPIRTGYFVERPTVDSRAVADRADSSVAG